LQDREKTPFCGFQLDISDDVSFTFKLEKTCMMDTDGVSVFPKNRFFLNFTYPPVGMMMSLSLIKKSKDFNEVEIFRIS